MTEQDDSRAPRCVFFRTELPAENRLDAEHREHVPGDRRAGEALGLVTVRQCQTAAGDGADLDESVGPAPPIPKIQKRHAAPLDPVDLMGRVERHELLRCTKRQRTDGDRVDHAEYRAVHADSQREAGNGQCGKARIRHERAYRVAQVLEQRVHWQLDVEPQTVFLRL